MHIQHLIKKFVIGMPIFGTLHILWMHLIDASHLVKQNVFAAMPVYLFLRPALTRRALLCSVRAFSGQALKNDIAIAL